MAKKAKRSPLIRRRGAVDGMKTEKFECDAAMSLELAERAKKLDLSKAQLIRRAVREFLS